MLGYDAGAVKAAVNLVELAGRDTQLRHVSGEEYAGPCPKCGGDDRFRVKPGGWFCRQCYPRPWADAITYIRWRDGVEYAEACARLGGQQAAVRGPRTQNTAQTQPEGPPIRTTEAPSERWQTRARALVAYAEAQLWADPDALAYLRGRGLRDETIRAARLGWCPKRVHDPDPAGWGLEEAKYPKGVTVVRGWVIPCEARGQLWYVKVRRPKEDIDALQAWLDGKGKGGKANKYQCVTGGPAGGVVYGLDDAEGATDLVIAEGELNALVLRQELAGVAGVVSVGSASGRTLGAVAVGVLARVPRAWAIYDADDAGQKGAAWLGEVWARVRQLAWPWGDRGDVNDAHLAGESLPGWIVPQLGPDDPAKRRQWLLYHLERLNDAAFEAGTDDSVPALRAFLSLNDAWLQLTGRG